MIAVGSLGIGMVVSLGALSALALSTLHPYATSMALDFLREGVAALGVGTVLLRGAHRQKKSRRVPVRAHQIVTTCLQARILASFVTKGTPSSRAVAPIRRSQGSLE